MMKKKRFPLFSIAALLWILFILVGCQVSETVSYPPGNEQIPIRGLKPAVGYNLPALGANFGELEWHFSIDPESWEISADESEREMKKKIAYAHQQGLKVYLLPFLHFKDKPGAVGAVTTPDVGTFLAQLDSLAVEWAEFAEENKVELFTPVNELQHWVGREEGKIGFTRASEWYQHILPKIREAYSGELITGYNSFFYDLISQDVSDYEINQTGYDYISLSLVPHRIKNYDDYMLLVDHLITTAEYWEKKFGAKGIIVTEVGVPESSDSLPFYQQAEQQGESYGTMRAHLYDIFFSRTIGKIDGYFISDWGKGEAPFYLDESGEYMIKSQREEATKIIKKYYLLEGEREASEEATSPIEASVIKEADTTTPAEIKLPLEEKPLTPEEQFWEQRIDAALASTDCPAAAKSVYPASYYQGPFIDTHLHIPGLADWPAEEGPPETQPPEWYKEDDERNIQWGEDPFLGHNVNIGKIDCTLKQEGTIKAFSWFPIFPEIPQQQLEVAKRTAARYPDRLVPFISPTEEKAPTVDAKKLKDMLWAHPDLFKGYGEIGIYDTTEWKADDFPPDAPLFMETYPIIEEYKLVVYFHPGERHEDNIDKVLGMYPHIIFIVHGEEIEDSISDLMNKHENIYYTVDFSFSEHFPLFVGESKEEFMAAVEKDFEKLLAADRQRWKTLIERHPGRFMWGTDRGDAVWNYDLEVGLLLVRYARAFVGRLDPAVQEKFAYQNAERLLKRQ